MPVRKSKWSMNIEEFQWDCIAWAWVSLKIRWGWVCILAVMTQPTSCKVRCKYFESGCGWRSPLSDRATHQAVCPVMENVTLRNQLANAQRRITSLENDKKKCENEKQAVKARCFENRMDFIFFPQRTPAFWSFKPPIGGSKRVQSLILGTVIKWLWFVFWL